METSRSWSEENLFRVQTKEEIERLKKEISELKKLEDVVAAQKQQIETQETDIQKYRVQVYDLTKKLEKASKKKVSINAKNSKKNLRGPIGARPSPRLAPKTAKFDDSDLNAALAFLEKEEKGGSDTISVKVKSATGTTNTETDANVDVEQQTDTTTVSAKSSESCEEKPTISTSDAGDVKSPRSESNNSSVATPRQSKIGDGKNLMMVEGKSYEFDLRALADAVPGILLEVALDAQDNFVNADEDGNGVLDFEELQKVMPIKLMEAQPEYKAGSNESKMAIIRKAAKEVDLPDSGELNFLESVKITLKLREWAISLSPKAIPEYARKETTNGSAPKPALRSTSGNTSNASPKTVRRNTKAKIRKAESKEQKEARLASRLARGNSEVSTACKVM